MATRGHVGYRNEDGSIVAVYHHWDSYPDHLGTELVLFARANGGAALVEEVERALTQCGFRSFPETYGDFRGETCEREEWLVDDRARLDNDYAYIFDPDTGELVEFYQWGKLTKPKWLGEV